VDDASRPVDVSRRWDGTWELAVVAPGRRPAVDRVELRRAASTLHLGELREGVWLRPDNLAADRLPSARAVVADQCVQFRRATVDLGHADLHALFALGSWAATACRLTAAIVTELDAGPPSGDDTSDVLTFRFLLSVAVVRHLQLDPSLPVELLRRDWPAPELRRQYAVFDAAFKRSVATRT
jgi:phenylacetic acid degradation operon negative regulatory protein